jgi:hypothetical protein
VQGNIYHIEKSGRKNSKSCNLTLVNLSDNAIVYEKEIDFNGHFSFHVKRGYYLLCLADQSLNYKTLYVPIDLNSDTDLGDFILQLDIASEDPLHAFYFEQEGDIRRYILNASLRKNDIGWMLNQIIKY